MEPESSLQPVPLERLRRDESQRVEITRWRPRSIAPAAEADSAPDLRAYWFALRKRQWTFLAVFLSIFVAVLLGTLKQTPIYVAKALLEIEKQNPNILTVQELFELETVSDTYLETQYKVLRSDSVARRVIDRLRLDREEEFSPPPGWWSAHSTEAASGTDVPGTGDASGPASGAPVHASGSYRSALEAFRERLSIDPVKRSRLVEIRFESRDPQLAAQVVNTLAESYIDMNLAVRWEATQKATEWLSQQLAGLKVKLERSEEELQTYAQQNGLLFLNSEKGISENIVNERLRQLQEELTKAQAARAERESLRRLVRDGDASQAGALPGVFDSKLMQDLTVRLAELRREHAQLAATFTPEYPKVKQVQSQIDEIEAVLEAERARGVQLIINEYQAAVQRESLLQKAFNEQEQQSDRLAGAAVQYNILKREVETNKQLYDGLLQRLKEAGVSSGLKASNVRIVDIAEAPKKPARPRILLNLMLGVVLGLGLATGAAFLQEHLDNTLKSSEDVERHLHLPSLAIVPSVESLLQKRSGVYGLYGRFEGKRNAPGLPASPAGSWHRIDPASSNTVSALLTEAFRGLRTSVLLSTAGRPPRSLLVTSAQPGEGKTTVSTNLSISLAQLGQRVLLIDGDMRRPNVHKAFSLSSENGLVSALTGHGEWPALVQHTQVAGLDALVCGPVPPNPAELLSSERMRTLLREAMETYAFVVVDSPPLLNVADTRILATLIEGVILVVKGGATPREAVKRAHSSTVDVAANVIGAVLNNLDIHRDSYGYYQYDHYYSYGAPESKHGNT